MHVVHDAARKLQRAFRRLRDRQFNTRMQRHMAAMAAAAAAAAETHDDDDDEEEAQQTARAAAKADSNDDSKSAKVRNHTTHTHTTEHEIKTLTHERTQGWARFLSWLPQPALCG